MSSLDERRRLLVYAFESAAPACGFEIVKLVAEFQAAKPSGSE